jgi:carboxymethylenebutenolidase
MALRGYLVGEIAQDYADGLLTRREAIRRLGLLGLGATAASVLAACGDDDDAAETTVPAAAPAAASSAAATVADASTTAGTAGTETTESGAATSGAADTSAAAGPAETITFAGPAGELIGAWAAPSEPFGAVLVIHENRGLTPHFYDLVGRLAGEGYAALCVDLLSAVGGTAALADEGAAQADLGAASPESLLADLGAGLDELEARAPGVKLAAVGFCFGGGMSWALLQAGEPRLAAVVPFYGPAPDAPDFSGSSAAVLGIYAELDDRVNASRDAAEAALQAAGLTFEIRTFAGVDHAFFNDTGARYNEQAAAEAYAALLDWFGQHLAG